MPTYIEYELDEGTTMLIEAPEGEPTGLIKVSRNAEGNVIVRAKKSFSEALKAAKIQASLLLQEIEDLHVDEAEIKFGLSTTGELDNLALGRVGLGVNYEVTLKWKKKPISKRGQ
ncbi:MAG: hypothetical protein GY796_17640 [Chloroflexi bacterium]|nr:hypothetical protein [Chloroflexota bacterium]